MKRIRIGARNLPLTSGLKCDGRSFVNRQLFPSSLTFFSNENYTPLQDTYTRQKILYSTNSAKSQSQMNIVDRTTSKRLARMDMEKEIHWQRQQQLKCNKIGYKTEQKSQNKVHLDKTSLFIQHSLRRDVGNRYFSTSPSIIEETVDEENEEEIATDEKDLDWNEKEEDEEENDEESSSFDPPSSSFISSAYGTGRRKASVARVWLRPSKKGNGDITINEKPFVEYFPRLTYREKVIEPFVLTNTLAKFDVFCRVHGGGHTGQAGAISLGIARALVNGVNEQLYRPPLKKEKLLTRDARVVERKKSGQPKARKKDQWVKR